MKIVLKNNGIIILGLLLLSFNPLNGQRLSFLENFKYGFGGGLVISQIVENEAFNIYEDLSGANYESTYSTFFSNISSHYYFHAEYQSQNLRVALRPGTYSYRFQKNNAITFDNDVLNYSYPFLLRYFNIPIDLKYTVGMNNFTPVIGINVAYGMLMGSANGENSSFIGSKITLGPMAGLYYDLNMFSLNFNAIYSLNTHVITNMSDRYITSVQNASSQSDIRLNDLSFSLGVLFSLEKKRFRNRNSCNTYR